MPDAHNAHPTAPRPRRPLSTPRPGRSVSSVRRGSVVDALRSVDGRPPFSVEFLPPRDAAAEERLWRALRQFEQLRPAFASVTYGAGGSTSDRTVRVTGRIAEETTLLPLAHLTAVGHSVADLRAMIGAYADRGITNILALRGDPPGDPLGPWIPRSDGLTYAEQLVRLVKELGSFHVGVACVPQGHHRSPNLADDTRHLADKLRAGADYSITQVFFDPEDYLRLRDRLAAHDPEQGAKPIIPEIMPITSMRTVSKMAELSGSPMPTPLVERLERAAGDDPEANRAAVRAAGIEIATELCERLIAEGVPGLHFITMNFARATREVLTNLGYTVELPAQPAALPLNVAEPVSAR